MIETAHTLTHTIRVNLHNEELVRALTLKNEEAEKANLAKTRFLASASHDLRQPLQTVGLLTGIMHERANAQGDRVVTEKAMAAVQSMEELLNALLDISKLDAGAVVPTLVEFPIHSVLESLTATFTEQAHKAGLKFTVRPSKFWVRSDAAILERILNNLVANALRYTRVGRVLVACRRLSNRARIQVWDTGIGIAQQYQNDVFLEFFQIGNLERDRTKGLGLGLSIVRRSAELLGHSLSMKSTVGKGSCFSIDIPLVAAHPEAIQRDDAVSTAANDPLFGRFIVVVDDEQDVRFALRALLEQWGCEVLCAASCDEAVSQLQGSLRTPDLVISDYRLHDGKTGVTAIREIRDAMEDEIPSIVLTGDIAAQDIRRVTEQGLALLHKPVSAQRLRREMSGLLAPTFLDDIVKDS